MRVAVGRVRKADVHQCCLLFYTQEAAVMKIPIPMATFIFSKSGP